MPLPLGHRLWLLMVGMDCPNNQKWGAKTEIPCLKTGCAPNHRWCSILLHILRAFLMNCKYRKFTENSGEFVLILRKILIHFMRKFQVNFKNIGMNFLQFWEDFKKRLTKTGKNVWEMKILENFQTSSKNIGKIWDKSKKKFCKYSVEIPGTISWQFLELFHRNFENNLRKFE